MSKTAIKCPECKEPYSSASTLHKHKVKHHGYEPKLKITCSLCNFKVKSRPLLLEHLSSSHEYVISEENLTFNSDKEFLNWKETTEIKTNSFFVSNSAKTSTRKYFYCNRSGDYEPHPAGAGKINGYRKIGSMCPARIRLKIDSGILYVRFTSSHFGHVCEGKHLNIQKNAEEFVVEQMKTRVTRENILLNIKDKTLSSKQPDKPMTFDRLSLISMKDLTNISIRNNLLHTERLNKDDFISAQLKIEAMQKEGRVLFYQNDSKFILALMTEQQLSLLKQFGSEGIMVDSTFGVNKYNIKLTILMIRDENLYGFPVCLILSDNLETSTFVTVFTELKTKLGMTLKVRFIMSDMANQYSNAWQQVMGEVQFCLFCTFHVRKCWIEHYNKIDSPFKEEIAEKLVSLLTERNTEQFEDKLMNFEIYLNKDKTNKQLMNFHSYFFGFYAPKKEKWAYCYRRRCEINTNNNTEAQNRKLKETYTDPNIRLDNCLEQLTKYVEDIHFQRLKEAEKATIGSKLREIHNLHKKAINLQVANVNISIIPQMNNSYEVQVGRAPEAFIVTQLGKCNHPCRQLSCEQCNACLRCFHCTCNQREVKMNMCIHIHLVCLASKNLDGQSELPLLDNPDIDKIRQIHESAIFKEKKSNLISIEDARKDIETSVSSIIELSKNGQLDESILMETREIMIQLLAKAKRKPLNENKYENTKKQRRFNNNNKENIK